MDLHRELDGVGRLTRGLILTAAVLASAAGAAQVLLLSGVSSARILLEVAGVCTVVQLVAALGAGVSFLRWFHRAATNAVAVGGEAYFHLPGWAVGGFLIPVLNVYRPYVVARELEKVAGVTPSPLVAMWWAAYLARGAVGLWVMFAPSSTAILAMMLVEWVAVVACSRFMLHIERAQRASSRPIDEIAETFA